MGEDALARADQRIADQNIQHRVQALLGGGERRGVSGAIGVAHGYQGLREGVRAAGDAAGAASGQALRCHIVAAREYLQIGIVLDELLRPWPIARAVLDPDQPRMNRMRSRSASEIGTEVICGILERDGDVGCIQDRIEVRGQPGGGGTL